MAESTRNPDEIGSFWEKTSAKGPYMTGNINGEAVVCFRNDRKKPGSNQPDWRVLKSRSRDGSERRAEPVPPAEPQASAPLTDDDIPFLWILAVVLAGSLIG